MVLRNPDEVEDDDFGDAGEPDEPPPVGMVIAETEAEIRTITVGRAVLELDMTGYPVVVFRNAAHGGLSVVYRRPDGNVGWIDPERTSKVAQRTRFGKRPSRHSASHDGAGRLNGARPAGMIG